MIYEEILLRHKSLPCVVYPSVNTCDFSSQKLFRVRGIGKLPITKIEIRLMFLKFTLGSAVNHP